MRQIVIAAAILLTACGSGDKSATVGGTTVTTNEGKGTTEIRTEKGTLRAAEGDAAANVTMPDYAPRYPGATITGVIESESDGKKHKMVTFSTTDPIGKVLDFYKAALAKGGWKTPSSFVSADGGMVSAENGGKAVSIAISRDTDTGKTDAVITLPGE